MMRIMTKIGRPAVWEEARPEWVRLYREEKLSRGEIARQYGTSVQTVTRQLRVAGVDLEARQGPNRNAERTPEEQAAINAKVSKSRKGKGTGPRVEREERTCQNTGCGQSFTYIPGKTGSKYCSKSCQMSAQGSRTAQEARAEYAINPVKCPCGDGISYEYRHNRQFCSPEHRKEYGAKRERNPENHITFVCLNCEQETTRPRTWGKGHFKYCSNSCAQRHTKTRRFYAVGDFDIVFESSWETLFWSTCQFLGIPVERFDRERGVEWRDDSWYAPDFWLPTLSLAVEIKGLEDDDDRFKWATYADTKGELVVLNKEFLNFLRIQGSPSEFLNVLSELKL